MKMKLVLLALAVLTGAAMPASALADEALAKARGCLACHTINRKVVGPSYRDVAKKYSGDADAVKLLTAKIMHGGAGVWGKVPMPANAAVSEADARALAVWVLSLQ